MIPFRNSKRSICGCLLLAILLLAPGSGFSQDRQLKSFPLSSVQLLDSPFRQAQQTDLQYLLALDADRLLAPYLREAGLPPKAQSYGNWENTGLDGHIGGHYLTALALMYAATGQEELRQRLNYMVDQLDACQQKMATATWAACRAAKPCGSRWPPAILRPRASG